MPDIEHPDIARTERTGYHEKEYLDWERDQEHSSSQEEDE